MEELIFGSLIIWALGRITKKKAEAPAPGTIAPPALPRATPQSNSANAVGPVDPSGAPGAGRRGIL